MTAHEYNDKTGFIEDLDVDGVSEGHDEYELTTEPEPDQPYDPQLELEAVRMDFSARFQALELANRVSSTTTPTEPKEVVARAEEYYMFLTGNSNEEEPLD